MRTIKIVADSSANLLQRQAISFASAPLKIQADQKEFVDDAQLDVQQMVQWFADYKGKSRTACPGTGDWLEAFGDAEDIFCVTITSGLSGSYGAACAAGQLYREQYPDRRVFVIDSLSTGPEMVLIIEKLEAWIGQGMDYEEICRNIVEYQKKTGLVFMLVSLKNFAANGRVSPVVAKLTGFLGIRIVGKASDQGTLEPMHKCRGQRRSLDAIMEHLKEVGLRTGKLRIAHCNNEAAALELEQLLAVQLPQVQVRIHPCRGLCSYYAEDQGLLVGYEKF